MSATLILANKNDIKDRLKALFCITHSGLEFQHQENGRSFLARSLARRSYPTGPTDQGWRHPPLSAQETISTVAQGIANVGATRSAFDLLVRLAVTHRGKRLAPIQ
jgi:hypothetical protein